MKLASTVIWMLIYATIGVFATWILANCLDQIADGLSVMEAIGLFCWVFAVSFAIRRIGDIQQDCDDSKKDKG